MANKFLQACERPVMARSWPTVAARTVPAKVPQAAVEILTFHADPVDQAIKAETEAA